MLDSFYLIFPEFALILLGIVLGRSFPVPQGTWRGIEKLVYYVLFPPLLFRSIVNANLHLADAGLYLLVAVGTMLAIVALSCAVPKFIHARAIDHASIFQCGFRFNSYIGFAVVMALLGQQGLALMSIFIAIWVPISNFFAVAALAKNQRTTSMGKAICTNPLILATLGGLIAHSLNITLPETLDLMFSRLGTASLVLGLLAIGVSLKFNTLREYSTLITWAVVLRLIIVPCLALGTVLYFHLPTTEALTFLIFAMLPTANSCYILTVNMNGNGPLVASIMTLQTLMAMITMPIFLSIGQACL